MPDGQYISLIEPDDWTTAQTLQTYSTDIEPQDWTTSIVLPDSDPAGV